MKTEGGQSIGTPPSLGLINDGIPSRHQSNDTKESRSVRESDVFSEISDEDNQNFFRNVGREVVWTEEDRERLKNVDELHTRLLEYHNNVHARTEEYRESGGKAAARSESFGMRQGLSLFDRGSAAAIINPVSSMAGSSVLTHVNFLNENKTFKPEEVKMPRFHQFLHGDLPKILKEMNAADEGLLWLRVQEPTILKDLAGALNMHELCASGFSDLRAFSSFVPVSDGLFVSFCNFVLNGTKINMYKIFVYVSKHVCVTYEREIMPNLLIGFDESQPECTSPQIMRRYHSIGRQCAKMGGIYLISALALQSLASQDTLIDFFSRNLFYFRQKVSTRQYHKEKLIIARQMHIIGVAVIMIKKTVSHNEETFVRLLSAAMSGVFLDLPGGDHRNNPTSSVSSDSTAGEGGGNRNQTLAIAPRIPLLAPMHLLVPEHTPYLLDLVDSYKFSSHLLGTEIEEVQALVGAMDALTTLRSINTSTLLSFVATIFLPLNFLTGVFGTNFFDAETNAYFMAILNDPQGPMYFVIMCVVSFIAVCLYFMYNGWVDLRVNWRKVLSFAMFGLIKFDQPEQETLYVHSRKFKGKHQDGNGK